MNKSTLDGLIRDFNIVTGMEISVISSDFHSLAICRCSGVNYCSALHRYQGVSERCKASDIKYLTEAKESESTVIYNCHAGVCEVIVPIVGGDSVRGFLFASLGINTDEFSDSEVLTLAVGNAENADRSMLLEKIKALPHLTSREIDAHVGIMKLLAEHIGNDESLLLGNESIGTQIKYYVKKNLSRKLSLSDIAWNLHCSTVTLTEHFKKEFGITVNEYITKKRMELSEKLLLTTSLPLREISENVGFSDVEYFSRTFKKCHGISPSVWREENKQKP